MATNSPNITFQCDSCPATYRGYSSIIGHVRKVHGVKKLGYHRISVANDEPLPKKKRRALAPENEAIVPMPSKPSANFCPCCGFNLQAVNAAIALNVMS